MMELSVVIPALNEEKTIVLCVQKALASLEKLQVAGEVVVADNGSVDRTREFALNTGARVISVKRRGYGSACFAGLQEAKGKYLIMADADDSYNFTEMDIFFYKLKEGYDFVIGNRFRGKIEKNAMPLLHRYLGTPVLTTIMNVLFGLRIGDVNCGMRGMTKAAFERMHLKTSGMEFATEMVIKSALSQLKIAEVPCNLYKDKRGRKPHLNTWRDGWRHLRFILLFKPTWTFLGPGMAFSMLGTLGMLFIFIRDIFAPQWGISLTSKHILSALLIFIIGNQIISLGLAAEVFSFTKRFESIRRKMIFFYRNFTLERGIVAGLGLMTLGAAVFAYLFISFYGDFFPRFSEVIRLDLAVFAIAFAVLGIQLIFTSFLLSLFYLKIH